MKISIPVEFDTASYSLKEDDYYFTCDHNNAEVEPPCCSGFSNGLLDCGCGGSYSVYCWDCNNEDLTDEEAEKLIEDHIAGKIPDVELEACGV